MPIKAKLMKSLVKEYGAKKGRRVYFAMEHVAGCKELFKGHKRHK
jgi:hypothetical protein